ncbi:hypothetical protein CNBG_10061 [Cryptococcus deuterogattii R265]|uniref:uncharacterized protein n=1 Tax=Cryptococcus deuterogattii (strain R265) TaxID=294750 RepID=UPI001938B220|nr:hypothetical protein CNBG_10061 [Cryptococcus deuterogattii R265]
MAMDDRGINENRQFHQENKELKIAILNLERERMAKDNARRDREEQTLEEHRRMEMRMKQEEMECKRRKLSAKEDALILKFAHFVLSSVSGDTEEAYKKAVHLYESQGRQREGMKIHTSQ